MDLAVFMPAEAFYLMRHCAAGSTLFVLLQELKMARYRLPYTELDTEGRVGDANVYDYVALQSRSINNMLS